MEWQASTWWWIAAGLLVAGELATGTFYLLMLALGGAAAAVAAHAQGGLAAQVAAAALVGGGAVIAWHRRQSVRAAGRAPAPANPDIHLDVGERVQVEAWNADGTARVQYRGAAWNVRFVGAGAPAAGPHVIDEVRHNELAVRRAG
jgi:membrane protein implicated in regulation of membrane protease activity